MATFHHRPVRGHRRGQAVVEFAVILGLIGTFIVSMGTAGIALVQQHSLSQSVAEFGAQLMNEGWSDDTVLIDAAQDRGLTIDPARDGLRITVTDAAGNSDEYGWGASDFSASYGDLVTVEAWLADPASSSSGFHWPLSPQATWSAIADRNSLYDSDPAYATPRAEGGIGGVISDSATDLPIASAIISLSPGAQSTTSDVTGSFSLPAVPAGNYTVLVSAPGYEPYSASVTIYDGATTVVTVALAPENS